MRAIIDGRANPELVSDESAIRMLMLSLASNDNEQFMEARLQSFQLGGSDLAIVRLELDRFRRVFRQLDYEGTVAGRIRPPTAESRAEVVRVNAAASAAALEAYANLQALLSEDGRTKLRAQVQQRKSGMRVLRLAPGPDAPPAARESATSPSGGVTRFESVRIVRSAGSGAAIGLRPHPDGWVRMEGVTLRQLIELASDLPLSRTRGSATPPGTALVGAVRDGVHMPPLQMAGGPDWIDVDRFDVEAYAGSNRPIDDVRAMLHAMLQERFALVARYERQPIETLALVQTGRVGAGRWLLKAQPDGTLPPPLVGGCLQAVPPASVPLPPTRPPGEPDWWRCGGSAGQSADGAAYATIRARPIRDLADALTRMMGRTVLDRTGLEGDYYAHVEFWWPRENAPPTAQAQRLDVVAAVDTQLGLGLRRIQVESEVLTIDRAERPQ